MPRTDSQKVATAYLSQELYDLVENFKSELGLKSISQAIAVIVERFFDRGVSQPNTKTNNNNAVEERLGQLEKKIGSMEFFWRDERDHMLEIIDDLLKRTEFLIPPTAESTVDSDVPSTAESTVDSDVPSTRESTVDSNVPSTAESTVDSDVPSTRESTVDSDVPSTRESTVDSDVPSTRESTVDSDVPSTRESTVDSNVPSTAESTVDSDVPSTRESTVDSDVPSTVESTVDSDVPSTVDKDHLWVICKVDKLDRDRFSCWTGSFKQGFTSDVEKAQTYQEKSLNRITNRIANSEHAADTSKEFVSCKTLGDLKKMTAEIASVTNY